MKNGQNFLFTIVLAITLAGGACSSSTDSGPPPPPEATFEGLGDLGGGRSLAYAVSADGSVVVGRGTSGSGTEAFIWTAGEGMQSLQAVLENEYNLDLTGWMLSVASGISDDGTVIVGHGRNPNGDTEAWRAFLGEPVAGTAASLL